MSQYGINVPPGVPVFEVGQVGPAAAKMTDEAGEVGWGTAQGTGGRCSTAVILRRRPCRLSY